MTSTLSPAATTSRAARVLDVLARLLVLPDWLGPHLQTMGARWWHRVSNADAREGWRWLAHNWHKVAAWWLTIGLALSVLFLLAALFTWQNPQLMLSKLMGWGLASFNAGGKLAGWGALVVLVLSLPVLLPALLGAGVLVVAAVLLVVMFAPVLVLGGVSFGVLLTLATAKRGGLWLSSYVLDSLGETDGARNLARSVRVVLGLGRSSATLEGKPRYLEGAEFQRYRADNLAANRGASILLGYVDGEAFAFTTEKHVYLTAPSRAGKGRDLLIPNLKRYPESVFVLDPKGENCKATAEARQGMGNTVAAFDPYGLSGQPCARFNPLGAVEADDMVTAADYLGEALIIGKDDHWNESARGLVRALALHILTATPDQLGGRARDLPTLRELLTGALDVTIEAMQESPALDGLVSRLAESFASTPPNERGSIVSTAQRGTKWLDNPKLAALFRAGEGAITFHDFRDEAKRLSVFVCLPADIFGTYPQVCRLLTTFALDTMMKSLTGRKRPVMFILDELAQLQHLPIVERAFTLGAGFGVQVWAIFQSVEQAKKLYSLDTLYGSAGFRGFFKIEDPESCAFAARCASDIMTPAQVRHMPEFGMLALLDGATPLYVERLGGLMPPR